MSKEVEYSKFYGLGEQNAAGTGWSINHDEEAEELSFRWYTGGAENAVNGFTVKAPFVEKSISRYKAPYIAYDPNYDNPF